MSRTRRQYKKVHSGAEGYLDDTVAPHDEDRRKRYIERHTSKEDWADYMSVGRYQDVYLGIPTV